MRSWEETAEPQRQQWIDVERSLHSDEPSGSFFHDKELLEQLVPVLDRENRSLLECAVNKEVCASAEIIKCLLAADKDKQTIFHQQDDDWLPIHIAVHVNAPVEVVRLLLDADVYKETLLRRTKKTLRPIHMAIQANAQKEVIQLLLDADVHQKTVSRTVLVSLLNGYTLEQNWMDNHIAQPLLDIILEPKQEMHRAHIPSEQAAISGEVKVSHSVATNRANLLQQTDEVDETVIDGLDEPKKTNPPNQLFTRINEQHLEKGYLPLHVYPMLAKSIAKSSELQGLMIKNSIERHAVFLMVCDFYAHVAIAGLFLHVSNNFVRMKEPTRVAYAFLYLLLGYFLLCRQLYCRARAQNWRYFLDLWNYFEVGRILLILACCVRMHKEVENTIQNEALLIWSGAFVFVGMIFSLRTTFLPFSIFVSGVLNIFITLLPFFIVSALVLLLFAYVYFVDRFGEDDDFGSLGDSYLQVYGYFVGGLSETNDAVDVVFGAVVVIIFLNVVIAIVSSAWERTSEHGAEAFWQYRLGFLAELRPIEEFLDKRKWERFRGLFLAIDRHSDRNFFDSIPWGVRPYSFVQNRDTYYDPKSASTSSTSAYEQVESMVCDNKRKHAMLEQLQSIRSFQADWELAETKYHSVYVVFDCLRWVILGCFYLIAGFISFGLLWPRSFRLFVFGSIKTPTSQDGDASPPKQGNMIFMSAAKPVQTGKINISEQEKSLGVASEVDDSVKELREPDEGATDTNEKTVSFEESSSLVGKEMRRWLAEDS